MVSVDSNAREYKDPQRVVIADKVHVHRVVYVDCALESTAGLNELFQHTFTNGNFEMAGICALLRRLRMRRVSMSRWIGSSSKQRNLPRNHEDPLGRSPSVRHDGNAKVGTQAFGTFEVAKRA